MPRFVRQCKILFVPFFVFIEEIVGAVRYSEGSLFGTRKFLIPGGSLIRNEIRFIIPKMKYIPHPPSDSAPIYLIFGLTNLISFSE